MSRTELAQTGSPNNADLIVRTLKQAGVSHGFGVPSGNVLPLMEAMRAGGMEFVLTAHEGSAGFAADAMARVTGRPGFCLATLGPGATNLATGVGCAMLDRSPMIAITCNLHQKQLGRRIQMSIDHHDLFRPLTKATLPLRRGQIAATLREALETALAEPCGPVHLDLPEDVALAATEETVPVISGPRKPDRPTSDALHNAATQLTSARRPLAVVGLSAVRMTDASVVQRFVETQQMPFATTTMAKGLIDENHPLSIGCIERACRQHQRRFLHAADLIIGIGYDPIEVEYEAWIGQTPLLHLDFESADTDGTVNIAQQVLGDVATSLEHLTQVPSDRHDWPLAQISGHKREFQTLLRPSSVEFCPHQAIDAVRKAMPPHGILTFDVGAHTHQIASQWTAHAPGTFQITNGWSSMGFGIPSAIGCKLAKPRTPVVSIIGDGCFQMTCGEVAVAARHELPIPIVVLDDRWLSLIQIKQRRRELPLYGTELSANIPDSPPAHYFGVPVTVARNAAELEDAVSHGLNSNGPTVIEARVDPAHYMKTVFD
ncbi:MAG: thiamine pyrophosphate-binding protein [Planctomycetaceae bacterium]